MVFFTWRSAILKSELQSTTKLVLLVLSTYMDDHGGGAFPNIKTIASDSGLSERAVCTHIEKAVDAGFIVVSKQKLAGKNWARNAYKISFPSRPDVYQERGTERGSAPEKSTAKRQLGRGVESRKKQGTERGALPSENTKNEEDFPNFVTLALNDGQRQSGEGAEPHAEGTEPHDSKALNEVQSISPVTSPKTSPIKSQQQHASGDADAEFAMTLDWLPEPNRFAELLDLRGVSSELASQDALNEFRSHWTGHPDRIHRQALWEHKLASSMIEYATRRQRREASQVIPSSFGETFARRQSVGGGHDL